MQNIEEFPFEKELFKVDSGNVSNYIKHRICKQIKQNNLLNIESIHYSG